MAARSELYRVRIFPSSVSSSTGSPEFTFQAELGDVPRPGGQTVRLLEGRTETRPWTIDLVDQSSAVTSKLSTSGRMDWIGRIAQFQRAVNSTASTAFATRWTGRVTDLALADDVASYRLTLGDERWLERSQNIFTTANTSTIIPLGINVNWMGRPATPAGTWICRAKVDNLVLLEFQQTDVAVSVGVGQSTFRLLWPFADSGLHSRIRQIIIEDVKPIRKLPSTNTSMTEGNFTHLRFRNTDSSTTYEIASFDQARVYVGFNLTSKPTNTVVEYWQGSSAETDAINYDYKTAPFMWVVWPTSQPAVGDTIHGYVWMPTAPPNDVLPLHVGGDGTHPATFAKTLLNTTTYGNEKVVRVSTSHFDTLAANPKYGVICDRITQPWQQAEYLERRIYQVYGFMPTLDTSGRIAPKSFHLPQSSEITLANLYTFTSTNCATHPTFEHPSREQVTRLRFEYRSGLYLGTVSEFLLGPLYLTSTKPLVHMADHDRQGPLPAREHRVETGMFPLQSLFYGTSGLPFAPTGGAGPNEVFDSLAREVFDRYGDGPVYSHVEALNVVDSTGTVLPGDFVKLNLDSFPNIASNARGGIRIMQVLSREEGPTGPSFDLIDAGPNLQATTPPTISLTTSTSDPRHTLTAVIGNMDTGVGARYRLQRFDSTNTTSTSTPSNLQWRVFREGTTADLTLTISNCPSDRRVWLRGLSMVPHRIRSAWSTADFANTAAITAPSALATTQIQSEAARFKWTPGSLAYPVGVYLRSGTGTLGSSHLITTLDEPAYYHDVRGLSSTTTYRWGVRHFDPFGGHTSMPSTTFTTVSTKPAAPALAGLSLILGAT